MVGRDWPRMLRSQLQSILSPQTAAVGLGSSLNCTAPGHCSPKGIESLRNITRQKCEWVWGLGRAGGMGHGAGEVQVGQGGFMWDGGVLDMGLES